MTDNITTSIWYEDAQPDDPFNTKQALCHGYNVYDDMLGNTRWVEMLFLLFTGEAPDKCQADLLEILAVALANPGPRDASVHSAMSGGVCGSTSASCLMAALATGAGQSGGGREIFHCLNAWISCGTNLTHWETWFQSLPTETSGSVWPSPEHWPGFTPDIKSTATTTIKILNCLVDTRPDGALGWLKQHLPQLEKIAGCPISITGVAACCYYELGLNAEQSEMMHLLLRLPGAAAHALEQQSMGYQNFPFGNINLINE